MARKSYTRPSVRQVGSVEQLTQAAYIKGLPARTDIFNPTAESPFDQGSFLPT
jgi:hypothetical protein